MQTNKIFSIDREIITDLTQVFQLVTCINERSKTFKTLTDFELKTKSAELQHNVVKNDFSEESLIEAYSLVKETCERQLNLIPFDVQIAGAISLHQNSIVEMQTGEGKTLTAVFPAYLNALSKKGVHILTFNDYLAKRDAEWMRPVYEFLGLSVGFIYEGMDAEAKRKAYNCDITYATAKEIGFDYLRSFIAYNADELVLRPFYFAIVDEADALLIDEARNPLVLAGNMVNSGLDFYKIASFAASLSSSSDFGIDEYSRNIFLKDPGIEKVEKVFGVDNLFANQHLMLHSAINLAIHARMLLIKDVDYVVKNGDIKLVDEFTGRIVEDRKWRNGLQTAVEAKEKVTIQSEGNILNSISLQHFICQYPKKSGMTGTAASSAEEFDNFYGLKVVVIPPNKPCIRIDFPDRIFQTLDDKNQAIIEEVKVVHKTGRPILIGTLTVKESESLAHQFYQNGIPCQILNAKNNELEARLVADAGRFGMVTISTNMAGRGTDILLGGNILNERAEIIALGGLYVLGTNRHESIRIDKQLRGRAGRQGDVGSSQFFVSLEDDLLCKYRLRETMPKKLRNLNLSELTNNGKLNRHINHIQRVMEGQAYDIRKTLFNYSDFIEKQRTIIQTERQQLITDSNFLKRVLDELDFGDKIDEFGRDSMKKLREGILFQYDKGWADHLDEMQQVREGIHLLRLGGQNPLREFHKKANTGFLEMCKTVDENIQMIATELLNNSNISLTDLGIKKPSSTWTYMINDNPFGKQLSVMLMSNIGLQADPLSAIMLGVYGIVERIKRWIKKDSE